MHQKVLSMILVLVMLLGLLSVSAFTVKDTTSSDSADTSYEYNIMFLDCGRKYYSVDSIKKIINNASAAGFNYIQLAVGNDGLRFLLNDMSLTVGNQTYDSDPVKKAIQKGNTDYNAIFSKEGNEAKDSGELRPYNQTTNELTQSEMDEIIAYAQAKGMGVIPCVNTPGHMDAILSAANSLTGTNCSYNGSVRTIDVTNDTAVAFTKALLQKYITYFAGKGCQLFNMGADEYANDIYTGGSMGFGNLQSTGNYSSYVKYVNELATMIKTAGMTPMAFNDGIYFNGNISSGTFDTDIIICYWSSGWSGYSPMSASDLASKGFRLVNTNGSYYWVLGKNDKCSASKASSFNKNSFSGNSTISNPAGSMFCIWSDYPGAESEADVISKTAATIDAFGRALPKVTSGTVTPTPTTPTKPETDAANNEYTISVGSSKTITVSGNYAGNYQMNPANVAAVTTKHQQGAASSISYSATASASIQAYWAPNSPASNVIDGDTSTMYWSSSGQTEGAYVQVDLGAAIPFDTVRLTSPSDTQDYCTNADVLVSEDGNNWTKIGSYTGNTSTPTPFTNTLDKARYIKVAVTVEKENWWQLSEIEWGNTVNGSFTRMPASGTVTTEAKDETAITFTGLSVGDATVEIGGVTYTIHVTKELPANALTADTITLEHWITNGPVAQQSGTSGDDINVQTISNTIDNVQTDDGVALDTLSFNPGYWNENTPVYFWKGVRLDSEHKQTDKNGVDRTAEGTDITHIRYLDGAWQYKTADDAWHYFINTDQLVAYYLQKTTVTKEVETYVKDWGYGTNETTPDYSGGFGQVALTVAVVYPDGTVSPAESGMYAKSTTIFNYWNNRDIGIIAPKNNSDYNISKITVTDGTRDGYRSANVWYTDDTIIWDKKTTAAGGTWYDETEVWNKSSGTTPMVNGKASNITWPAKNTAKLVLIYLEPVVKETNLNIVYWDDTANRQINPNTIQISMAYNQGDDEPTYTTALKNGSGESIGSKTSWSSNVVGDENYLPNDAYVVNSSNVNQTISKDMTQIEGIAGNYTSGLYEYRSADISADGKTLTLHYGLKNTGTKTYVVDFGLPVTIPLSDLGITDLNTISWISLKQENEECLEDHGTYGTAVIDKVNKTVTYTLDQTLDNEIAIPINIKFTNSNEIKSFSFHVIPATSVYYEDSFATFTDGTGKAADAKWTTVMDDTDPKATTTQTLSELGSKDVYGHDAAYADSTKLSMGSARKVTVSANMVDDWTDGSAWPSATFTFKGTGFDVISLTDNNSGMISVKVYAVGSDGTETLEKAKYVNNYYGYECKDGVWTVNNSANNALYQIPVIKVDDLAYGTHKVVITTAYASYADKTGDSQYSFWLDAIRVYDPMGKDNATYTKDGEGYPQYIKLRDQLAKENGSVTTNDKLLFIDGAEKAEIATYANYGPNNEVYLAKGQAITFTVPGDANIASVQIGAKAPNGSAAKMVVNGTETNITSATEMYYEIDTEGRNFTIANNGNGILSLTNLKITFTDKPDSTIALTAPTAEEQTAAVMSVRALFAAPEQTFEPEHFTAKWSRNVRKGGTATLTVKASADVESITVNGEEITVYTTKTARSFWGAKETYHVFTYRVTNAATADYSICALNGEGAVSDPITATLTVRPSVRDWWNGIFDKWKH